MLTVVDIETTGLQPREDHIVEVGLVQMDEAGLIRGSWSTLVRATRYDQHGFPVDPLTFIHGIPASELVKAPRWAHIAHRIAHALDGATIIGHNARKFDVPFLKRACARAGYHFTPGAIIDTLERDRIVRHTTGRRTLTAACAAYGIATPNAHRALNDCLATAELATRQAALIGWA